MTFKNIFLGQFGARTGFFGFSPTDATNYLAKQQQQQEENKDEISQN